MKLLLGGPIAQRVLGDLKKRMPKRGLSLAVVQVGESAVSKKYIAEKSKAAQKLGIRFLVRRFPFGVSQKTLEREIKKLASSKLVHGIVVQLPLPPTLFTQKILNCVPTAKDVDVLSSKSFERFKNGTLKILPPTVCAVSLLLEEQGISFEHKRVVLVGRGRLVGRPLEAWFLLQGVKPVVVDARTKDISKALQKADVVISGTGKTGLVKGGMIKKGAVVIDAGTSIEAGRTKGDVDFKSVVKKASFVSPVPGGVGPLTVACLFSNLVELARIQKQ